MITPLSIEQVIALVKENPEQAVFDWKRDFTIPNNDLARGEIVKDISAIANATISSDGFIVYGVDPNLSNPIRGVSQSYDDARIQQLVRDKVELHPTFLYYEIQSGDSRVAVIQIECTRARPFVIKTDIGKVRKGQMFIRRGSSTDTVSRADLFEFFYGQTSGYLGNVLQNYGQHAAQLNAEAEYMRENRERIEQIYREMEAVTGVRLFRRRDG